MFVSIVIPAKNEETNIERLLTQLSEQSFKDFEVIVADAFSTDRTREIAKSLSAVIVDGGLPGAGRNLGAAVAKGDIFLFMDADAILRSDHFLQDTLSEMRHKQLDLAAIDVRPSDGNQLDRLTYRFYNAYTHLLGKHLPHAVGTCMFAKRFVHEAIGGFDETVTLAEDMHYARLGSDVGEFGILRSHSVYTPMRRWRKEGRVRLTIKYFLSEVFMILRGPIRKPAIYDFEYKQDSPPRP
ncbi:hypothetical protein COV06_01025 [Candidatus Uhrbacteria bacterium CG10_big_fil_rev_8_21_14_0_10_50_16]|uniref:Glycosyltransferase 2-like domain-containing protein n=1 Tax=Candidatus Uhrbacteria bacterium CG10_big_fil_rev_8_21_14_0_10_50_16 TaxID=1975039 RepID=A0A2H0RNF6_9BACT|nr:MAG: hypothetical protein COV06_01025 [Candidatus Uhrbacteria bacterium CG10_big_fil_rev_8_21_14_0_10_50_16]